VTVSLSAEQIQTIRERVDIVRVIGAYVALNKKGQRFLGLCPFHGEKTPSFSVSPTKGLYYCFGCHAGGDVFSFLMRHQGIDFATAVRQVAKEAGVELEPESAAEQQRRQALEELGRVNDYAQAFFEHALWREGGRAARAYLHERGVPEAFARERRLGYGGTPGELGAYLEAKRVPSALAGKAGLLSDDGRRSLFDGRLVFPIVDAGGRIAGFGGRRLGEGPGPKYINTRESPLFAKRRLLYGWEVAQEALRRTGRAIIVEGYMDVLACERAGLREAVAALGTAFTEEHAHACGRLAKEAILLFDGDAAGQAASRHAAEILLPTKLKTSVALLPPGQDPDSLLKQEGAAALLAAVAAAKPALEHFIGQAFSGRGLSIEDRAAAARDLGPLLTALPSGLERDLYTARLAEAVGVSVEQLLPHLKAAAKPRRRAEDPPLPATPTAPGTAAQPAKAPPPAALDRFEHNLLRDLLLYPQLRPRFGELAEFASDLLRALFEELAGLDKSVADALRNHLTDERMLASLVIVQPSHDEDPAALEARAERTFADALMRLKSRRTRAIKREAQRELEGAEARGEDTEELAKRIQNLTRRERELKRPGSAA
jgi:DNA primase